jgi:hypothetical protein
MSLQTVFTAFLCSSASARQAEFFYRIIAASFYYFGHCAGTFFRQNSNIIMSFVNRLFIYAQTVITPVRGATGQSCFNRTMHHSMYLLKTNPQYLYLS